MLLALSVPIFNKKSIWTQADEQRLKTSTPLILDHNLPFQILGHSTACIR